MSVNAPHQKAGGGPGGYGGGGHPIPLVIIGILALALWVIATLLSIEATEAWSGNSHVATFVPNFAVVLQIGELLNGTKLTAQEAKSYFTGWGIEVVTLIIVIGYEAAKDGILVANHRLTSWFTVGLGITFIWNIFTNLIYGWDGSNIGLQIVFGLFTSFVSTFFAIVSYSMLHRAYRIWRP
jgi:hypothetical protein